MLSSVERVSSGFTEFLLVYPGFTGFYWVLPGFTEFYLVFRVFPGFTRFYRVLLGFTGFLSDLGSERALLGFYRVWLGLARFLWRFRLSIIQHNSLIRTLCGSTAFHDLGTVSHSTQPRSDRGLYRVFLCFTEFCTRERPRDSSWKRIYRVLLLCEWLVYDRTALVALFFFYCRVPWFLWNASSLSTRPRVLFLS